MGLELLLAVDGGQSQTLALLATSDGRILGAGLSGPANHVHEPGGMARMERALRNAITEAFNEAGIAPTQVKSACFGMTGGAHVVPSVVCKFLECDILTACDDMVTALAGASLTRPGIVVIAGTGASAFGQTADGRQAKSDGWGYIMGDAGSGYDIGVQGMRAAAEALDGRGPSTSLIDTIPARFGVVDLIEVHAAVYKSEISRPQIASLAAVVCEAADNGDIIAQQLLTQASQSLAKSALAVLGKLAMTETGMPVYLTGGVFRAGHWILEPFKASLVAVSPDTEVHVPAFEPVIGALLMAMQQAECRINDVVIESIRITMPPLANSKSR
ncbi:N-acetylglucosamine kinase [Chloroflexota bacterium]